MKERLGKIRAFLRKTSRGTGVVEVVMRGSIRSLHTYGTAGAIRTALKAIADRTAGFPFTHLSFVPSGLFLSCS